MARFVLQLAVLSALLAGLSLLPGSEGWSGAASRAERLASDHRLASALGSLAIVASHPGGERWAAPRMGALYLRRGQPAEAAAFERAEAVGVGGPDLLLEDAEAARAMGDFEGSLERLRRLLRSGPLRTEVWARAVEAAARLGLAPREIRDLAGGRRAAIGPPGEDQETAYLTTVCWLDPGAAESRALLARAAEGSDGRVRRAASEMLAASAEPEADARMLAEARLLLAQGLVGPALARLDRVGSGSTASLAEALALRGHALTLLGRVGEAEEAARRSAQANPDHPLGSFVLGELLMARGDSAGAVAAFNRARRADPGNPAYLLMLADALAAEGDYADAVRAVELAVKAEPESGDVRLAAARFYVDHQYRIDLGLSDAQEAARLAPGSAEALGLLAWALHLSGRSAEALPAARTAVDLDPESPLLRYRLGSIHEALGHRAEALEQFEMVKELASDRQLLVRTEAALAELGRTQ